MAGKKALGDDPLNWIGKKKAGKKKTAETGKANTEATTKYLLTLPVKLHHELKHEAIDTNPPVTLGEYILWDITEKEKVMRTSKRCTSCVCKDHRYPQT